MIVVIGGAYQGKLEFARRLWKETWKQDGGGTHEDAPSCADGRRDRLERAWEAPVIDGFHHYIRRMIETEESPEEQVTKLIREILQKNPRAIIVMDEIGYGIVPVDPKERMYREVAGMAGQLLAREAKQVYRVICGIGTKIK